jgi:hypothetical protein
MTTKRKSLLANPDIQAAALAAKFAQEIGLPAGNYWESGIARNMAAALRAGESFDDVEAQWRVSLGLVAN